MATYSARAAVARPTPSVNKRLQMALGRDWKAAWLFYAPTAFLLLLLVAWPIGQAIYMSFTRTLGSSLQIGPFIGLQNYTDLLSDKEFWFSLGLTLKFTVLAEIFKPTLGVVAALLIHNLKRYRIVISALILLPWIVPGIVQALIWRSMFNPVFGALNYVLAETHISDVGLPWLGDPTMALYSVVLVNIWAGIPFFTITNLAGLKSVDQDLYAAAAVDGANAWQRFRHVTLPGIQYTLIVSTLLSTIFTVNSYGTIYLLTSGGPLNATRVIGLLTFERGFSARDWGSGTAIAIIMLPAFAVAIWFLASYMQAGTRAESGDGQSMQSRLARLIAWPFKMFFTLLFDVGEAIGAALSRGIGHLLGRGAEESLAGKKAGQRVTVGLTLLVLAVLLLFELFPFFFAFVSAFKTSNQITDMTSVLWPQPWTLQQFAKLFDETQFGVWYRNTILISIVATAIGVFGAAAGAYALARLRWRGSSSMSSVMLITYMMPGIVYLIPIYRIMAALGLNNTPFALMIVYPVFQLPFATWLLMGYYRSIPEELEDAAVIDGANRFQVFTKLILPLAKPALMAVTLFSITNAWNEFFYAYVLIRSDRLYTLAVGLYQMVFNDVFPLGQMMAACILMVVPVLIIYGYAQKFMTEGLTLGSVKG